MKARYLLLQVEFREFHERSWQDVSNRYSSKIRLLRSTSIGISLFLPYERNTEQVQMPAPVGSGGLG